MEYQEFLEKAAETIRTKRPDVEVSIEEVKKLQGQSYTGLHVRNPGEEIGVVLDVRPHFAVVQGGIPFEKVIKPLMFQIDGIDPGILADQFSVLNEYDRMKESLAIQIVGTEQNRELLADIPHKEMEDLSVVYYFVMSEWDFFDASILITNQMLEQYGISAEQLMKDAEEVAPRKAPAQIWNMSEVIADVGGGPGIPMGEMPLWVATITSRNNGAGVLAYPAFMEQAAEKLKGSFFILPSSTNEVLLAPDDGVFDAKTLDEMVRSVNQTMVAQVEQLTDHAYHYDAQARIFERADAYEARRDAREAQSLQEGSADEQERETWTVLLVEPQKYPKVVEIGTGLADLQNAVGGHIEVMYPFEEPVGIICNEEGKFNGMALNRALRDENGETYDIIAGSFLVAGLSDDDFCSLTPEQIKTYEGIFHQPEAFVKMGRGMIALPIPDEVVQHEEKAKGDRPKIKNDPEQAI